MRRVYILLNSVSLVISACQHSPSAKSGSELRKDQSSRYPKDQVGVLQVLLHGHVHGRYSKAIGSMSCNFQTQIAGYTFEVMTANHIVTGRDQCGECKPLTQVLPLDESVLDSSSNTLASLFLIAVVSGAIKQTVPRLDSIVHSL